LSKNSISLSHPLSNLTDIDGKRKRELAMIIESTTAAADLPTRVVRQAFTAFETGE
jgi:hypothetical protein